MSFRFLADDQRWDGLRFEGRHETDGGDDRVCAQGQPGNSGGSCGQHRKHRTSGGQRTDRIQGDQFTVDVIAAFLTGGQGEVAFTVGAIDEQFQQGLTRVNHNIREIRKMSEKR